VLPALLLLLLLLNYRLLLLLLLPLLLLLLTQQERDAPVVRLVEAVLLEGVQMQLEGVPRNNQVVLGAYRRDSRGCCC
jgi:hypothetical protein